MTILPSELVFAVEQTRITEHVNSTLTGFDDALGTATWDVSFESPFDQPTARPIGVTFETWPDYGFPAVPVSALDVTCQVDGVRV